jgi:putative addiction module CopG family antidote
MGTKNISLPKELEAYINAKVASGEYAHASEVVRDGVRLLMQEEARKLEWLREAIAKAWPTSTPGGPSHRQRFAASLHGAEKHALQRNVSLNHEDPVHCRGER